VYRAPSCGGSVRVDGLTPGQELRLGQDRWAAPSGIPPVAAALTLGLQAGGPGNTLNLVASLGAGFALMHHGVWRIVFRCAVTLVTTSGLAPAAPTPPTARPLGRVAILGTRFITVRRSDIAISVVGSVLVVGALATLGC
jgi:hypothetical protein